MGEIIRYVKRGVFCGWHIRFKDVDGRRKQRATHQPTREAARRYLVEVEARIARGLLGVPEPAPPAPTVKEAVERFLVEYIPKRCKRLDRYRRDATVALARIVAEVGARSMDTLTQADGAKLREALLKRLKPRTVKTTMGAASVLFNWAIAQKFLTTNPMRGLPRPAVEPTLEYLSRGEVERLLELAEQQAGTSDEAFMRFTLLHLALHTGLRRGELWGLRWPDLDVDARRLTVARSYDVLPKSGRPRHLRLPAECAPIMSRWLRRCPATPERLVFPVRGKLARQTEMFGIDGLMKAAGCRALTRPLHALRHSFASHYVMAGGNILSLQKILGHASLEHTLVYAHLAPDYLGDEMDRLSFTRRAIFCRA